MLYPRFVTVSLPRTATIFVIFVLSVGPTSCNAVNLPIIKYQQETVSFRAKATAARLRPFAMRSFHPHFFSGLS